jgi:precorrin-2 C(20)-methyltransferase
MSHFWAVGVGPGDPGLLTFRAAEVIACAQVIYHAGPEERQGRAWEIIRARVRPEQEIKRLLTTSMSAASAAEDWRIPYRQGVEQIAADCRRGLEVAFVSEGDPTLYSTAAYVWQLLAELDPEIPITIIPGVTSITAAAARVRWPLAQKNEMLRILPATQVSVELASENAHLCLLKAGAISPSLVNALQGPECAWEAAYVENVGTEHEWITHDLAQAFGRNSYFSLVLLRRIERSRPTSFNREPAASAGNSLAAGSRLNDSPTRGKVWVVGIGPGDPDLLTRQALRILQNASDFVGYSAYLKLLEDLGCHARLYPLPLGAEAERARLALDLARQGRQVALISSGDAGVYGMASVLLETAAETPEIEIEVIPGITAATAAAALLGAPLGHDFVCLSLSDLLTPWPMIERRLEAAARGDFVIALYNPASQRRTWQLPRACQILRAFRAPDTPVGLVHGAFRPGMRVQRTTLQEFRPETAGMDSTILIGSSRTRLIHDRLVTPRGYFDAQPKARDKGTSPGRQILAESFALIERELGKYTLPPWAFAVVRRMIHASADFEFAQSLRYSPDFEIAVRSALREHVPIVTDTEMVLQGIRTALEGVPGLTIHCHLNDPAARSAAELTRSAAGIRQTARQHVRPLLVIGNAPTALEEALRLIEEEGWRPTAIVGMPVGFIGVEEAKRHLQEQRQVPYLTCVGRKGGSAVAAAAMNALIELATE